MPRLTRRNYGRGHGYKLDGVKIPGVTTVTGRLPKPALTKWAAECSADLAVNQWDRLATLPPMDRHAEILWAHKTVVREAGVRGNRIHALGDKLAHGEPVEVPDDLRGPVEAYASFLDRWGIETIATETPLAHTRYRYGGTADLWAHVERLGETALLDLKTGKGVYRDVVWQLAGYRYADLWQPSGPESEAPLPAVDSVYVVHIRPDSVDLVPVEVDPSAHRRFLYLLEVHRALESYDEESPLGDALRVEDYPERSSS